MMRFSLCGKAVSGGVAVGPAFVIQTPNIRAKDATAKDPDAELRRIDAAVGLAQTQLDVLREVAGREAGEDAAEILDVQRMMLEDPDYREMIRTLVCERGVPAEIAVRNACEHFSRTFAETDDDYLQARAVDVRDVSNRLLACLDGVAVDVALTTPSVLVAEEMLPSQLMRIDRKLILATVSSKGAVNSHASILARALGIPAIVNVPIDPSEIRPGTRTLVDGNEGAVIFDPDERTANEYLERSITSQTDHRAALVERYAGGLELCVNIAGPEDLADGLPDSFAGVGLFRTEFLYLGRHDLPGEEEQYRVYCKVLEQVGGRKVVVRTFDLGADKVTEALPCATEANPALGCRGIRLAFAHPDVFKVQLRALLRAASCGDLRIMYPMITSSEEVAKIKTLVGEVAAELGRDGIAYRVPPQGVMIETPAAALMSDDLARNVDFFSIGTNDLTQYTLALDREGAGMEDYFCPRHPAVLQLIRMTADNAHRAGIPVSICGELASDPELVETFLDMHIDSLSI